MKLLIIALISLAALTACGPSADMVVAEGGSSRVKVERVAVIQDTLAYGDRRGIYVITDTKTGQEFIGVSGVGISETGSHQSGKNRMSDER